MMLNCRFKRLKKEYRQQSPEAILKVMVSTVGWVHGKLLRVTEEV